MSSKSSTPPALNAAPPEGPRRIGFHAGLAQFDNGNLMHEAEGLHAELVEIIMTRGGSGTLAITLSYERGEGGIQFRAELKLTKPKKARRAQFFYADKKGNTYQDDPEQAELPFGTAVIDFNRPAAASAAK